MEELIRNLKAAEDALETYRANARLSKISDTDAEQRLVASVDHAKAQIDDFNSRKEAFWKKYESDLLIIEERHKTEIIEYKRIMLCKSTEMGYDN